jgi:hypothetical protein
MAIYNFESDSSDILVCMGITEQRGDDINNAANEAEYNTVTADLQVILNRLDGDDSLTKAEAMLAGYVYGRNVAQHQQVMQARMRQMAQMFSGGGEGGEHPLAALLSAMQRMQVEDGDAVDGGDDDGQEN